MSEQNIIDDSPLGKSIAAVSVYSPALLYPVPREQARQGLGISGERLPFQGVDVWTAYELSWLDGRGKPQVAMGRMVFSCDSPNLVESKSLKLYFGSLNQTRFDEVSELREVIAADLGRAAGAAVEVVLMPLADAPPISRLAGDCIDGQDIATDCYTVNSDLLHCADGELVEEQLYSDLFRSLCPVTGQPDWASVAVQYRGSPIDRASLLRYLVSFRNHAGFHEQCVERIYLDIMAHCRPERLGVYARFLRRGGLDINPWRCSDAGLPLDIRLCRQ